MPRRALTPTTNSYNAAASACQNVGQPQCALKLLVEAAVAGPESRRASSTAATSSCEPQPGLEVFPEPRVLLLVSRDGRGVPRVHRELPIKASLEAFGLLKWVSKTGWCFGGSWKWLKPT